MFQENQMYKVGDLCGQSNLLGRYEIVPLNKRHASRVSYQEISATDKEKWISLKRVVETKEGKLKHVTRYVKPDFEVFLKKRVFV